MLKCVNDILLKDSAVCEGTHGNHCNCFKFFANTKNYSKDRL